MSKQLRDLVKRAAISDCSIADDATSASEFTGYVDTGCYVLNAMFSGSLYGGFPNNKIVAFAGETSVGKTYLALGILKNFLDSSEDAKAIYVDTEAAVTKKMMEDRGIDTTKVLITEPETLEKFKTQTVKLLNAYMELDKDDRYPLIVVLDSLSMLPSNKETKDAEEGSDAKDMTKQGIIRGLFRVLTLKCAKAKVPLIINSHVYNSFASYVPIQEVAGGGGLKYAASTIIFLRKKTFKDEKTKQVKGNLIIAKQAKGRLTRPESQVEMLLSFETGLDRNHGLLQLGEKYGIFKSLAKGYEVEGVKISTKELEDNLEKYLTETVMTRLEDAANKEFNYGKAEESEIRDEEIEGAEV